MIATCPTTDRLNAFVLGQLLDQESDELYGHLASCDSCQQQLEEGGSFSDSFVGQFKSETDQENHSSEPALLQATDRAKNLLELLQRPSNDTGNEFPAGPVPASIGEYEIQQVLGHGGMGTVYLARHTKLGRQVALKILSRHRLADPKMQGRFSAEMKAVGRMNHPNIVAAHDAREIDGVAVLVTEYIDGLNVGAIIRRTGPLSVANAAQIASQVANALAAIDQAEMVHRDIKPSNIMISRDGAVKLLDLGLARLQATEGQHLDHTATGHALGTVDYIAPEQVNDGRNVDIRADIYAFGCTLFKMLTGRPVFDDSGYPTSFAKMTAHVQTAPPTVSQFNNNIPQPLATFVSQMLEKDPARCPQTPDAVMNRLAPYCNEADLSTLVESALTQTERPRAATPATTSQTPARKKPLLARSTPYFIALATCLIGLGLGWGLAWLMGIEITIKHPNGTETKLNVANGSTVTIDADGNATVELPGTSSAKTDSGKTYGIGPLPRPETPGNPIPGNQPQTVPVWPISAIQGVWEFDSLRRDGGILIVDGLRYFAFRRISIEDSAQHHKTSQGTYSITQRGTSMDLWLTPSWTSGRSVILGLESPAQSDILTFATRGTSAGNPDFLKFSWSIELNLKQLRRLDWSKITAADQLPDEFSRAAWKSWKEMSAGASGE